MRASQTFQQSDEQVRKTGEEWLITMSDAEAYIPNVNEELVGVVTITTLSSRQYCVILNPIGTNGKPQLGQKRVVKGEKSFFLQPGEELEKGIQDIFVLSEEQGLVLKSIQAFVDKD
ncbi:major vault protein, partial [Cetorhinus maximus]